VGGEGVGVDGQALEEHLDGVVVVAGIGDGLAAVEENLGLALILLRHVAVLLQPVVITFGHGVDPE
jgi:hypothetical protein